MRCSIFFVVCSLAWTSSKCQEIAFDRNASLRISFKDTVVQMHRGAAEVSFQVSVSNISKNDYLLYGFTILEESTSNLTFYKQPSITAGMVPYLMDTRDNNGRNVYLGIVEEQLCGRPITPDSVYSKIKSVGKGLRDSRILLKSNSRIVVDYNVKLDPKRVPKPGRYYFKLLFFSGYNIVNLIPEPELGADAIASNAIVFQGYAESNQVMLIVLE